MKHSLLLIPLTLSVMAMTSGASAAQPTPANPWISLWNSKDLDGWSTWLQRPFKTSDVPGMARDENGRYTQPIGTNKDPLNVFTIVPDCDGKPAIRISGECFGELRSNRSFENYHLQLQFKWGEKKWFPRHEDKTPRDSGLLYHVHAEPGADGRTWARSIEMQIQEGDCGDLYAIGSVIAVKSSVIPKSDPSSYIHDPSGTWTYFSQSPGQSGRCVKSPDAEKPSGEWNTLEIVCLGDESIHIMNGTVVMRLHGPTRIDTPTPESITSGPIILQSEGAEVFYRDIKFRPITRIPAAYAE